MKEISIAEETFNLFLRTFIWKNDQFERQIDNKCFKFQSYEKKYYILFCINIIENCTLSKIDKMLFEKKSTISIAVSKLCDEGLIEKKNPARGDDGRKVYFELTELGKRKYDEFHQSFLDGVMEFVNSLSKERRSNYITGITNLNKVFGGIKEINGAKGDSK